MAATPPATPNRLQRSKHLSTFAHLGAVYVFHDLYGYLLQMSPDLLRLLDAFEGGADVGEVCTRMADDFQGQWPRQFVEVFFQHACLVDVDDPDELAALWPLVAIKGKWNVWRREGDRLTLWTAWGDAPVRKVELDEADTRIWDDIDGERRLAELAEAHDKARLLALVQRLVHSDVQALKLNLFPASAFAKRPGLAPPYLGSTMPYPRWSPADGPPPGADAGTGEVSPVDYYRGEVADADAQFDHQETTLSHLFRYPHPALGGRTYGAALVDALAERVPAAGGRLRILEIGGGLGFFARAVIEALRGRGVEVEYTIAELAPALAAAQRERLAGLPVTWREGDVLAADLADASFDWILANEMIGDLPARRYSRGDVGLEVDGGGEVDPAKLAALGRPGELAAQLGLRLEDATEPFYLLTGALELVVRVGRWLAPGGVAVLTEFGEPSVWPKLSTHLDHPELSIHFGHLHTAARAVGLEARIDFVMDLIGLDRTQRGLATTRSQFRALRAMLADAGVTIEKVGYTPELFGAALAGKLDPAAIGDLRWDKIEDRLMGLVPHEFKALVCRKPATPETPATPATPPG